jgi:hypothetical protein
MSAERGAQPWQGYQGLSAPLRVPSGHSFPSFQPAGLAEVQATQCLLDVGAAVCERRPMSLQIGSQSLPVGRHGIESTPGGDHSLVAPSKTEKRNEVTP